MGENLKPELSSLSMEDIRNKVARAIYSTESDNRYYYGVLIYPLEFVAYAKLEGRDTQTEDYTKFTYIVNSDETISVTAQEDVKMVFMPKAEVETEIANLKEEVTNKETEISTKLDEIIKLGETIKSKDEEIANKDTEIAELIPFKEQVEAAEAEAKKLEIAEAQQKLKEKLIASKYFTNEDIETSEELSKAIEDLNEKAIKEAIGSKVLEYASQTQEEPKEPEVEGASTKEENGTEVASVGLLNNYEYKEKNKENNSAIMDYIYS